MTTSLTTTRKIRSVFTVKDKKYLTPHLIRVVFKINEDQIEWLTNVQSGSNNKIFIPVHTEDQSSEPIIITRTYTNRKIDLENRELTIDFVAHGESSPASAWAVNAKPGDPLEISMKESTRPLVPDADFYLLVGDATALPVVTAIVEQLPSFVTAKVFLEVFGKEDEMMLCSAADISVEWLYNPHPEQGSRLADLVKSFVFPKGILKEYVYAATEYTTAKEIRNYFKTELNWDSHGIHAVSYWRAGQSEDETSRDRQNQRD
ncbi:siderophore-interacting protein [Chryseobacterium herbae]|uniref:Siderophore-interacting protein n=1 Tax=Chryseobacterium herbae TaxID=2976476 RepID=A0ABT2IYG0_9FLAO|nr:siderophore-interacting protein [Chryseobacterium sp. pc1-10]MCT2563889.1 siderophore-interacting protein [Chryseobacterium sp. pc1-10]